MTSYLDTLKETDDLKRTMKDQAKFYAQILNTPPMEALAEWPDPRDYIPREWDQQSRHFLVGPIENVRAYSRIFAFDFMESRNSGYIHFICETDDLVPHYSEARNGELTTPQTPKLTIHLLPKWQEVTHYWYEEEATVLTDLFLGLISLAATSYLKFGHEVDIATGYPAVFDAEEFFYSRAPWEPRHEDYMISSSLQMRQSADLTVWGHALD